MYHNMQISTRLETLEQGLQELADMQNTTPGYGAAGTFNPMAGVPVSTIVHACCMIEEKTYHKQILLHAMKPICHIEAYAHDP